VTELKSKEAQFIKKVFEQQELPKHPIIVVLLGQLKKLTSLIDENPEHQQKVRAIFDYIKANWE